MSTFPPSFNPNRPYGFYVPFLPQTDTEIRKSMEEEILWQWIEEADAESPPEFQEQAEAAAVAAGGWKPASVAQQMALECEADILLYGGSAGVYKALTLDTPIPTPRGWTTMGQLAVGDEVFDERGAVCRVVGQSPIFKGKKVYEVVFDDGTVVKTCGDHRWLTMTALERTRELRRTPEWRSKRRASRPSRGTGKRPDLALRNTAWAALKTDPGGKVRTTEELAASLIDGAKRLNHSIPIGEALSLPDALLPIDPYCLGAWLGDGTTLQAAITSEDPEVVRHFDAAGYPTKKYTGPFAWGIGGGFRVALRATGVLGNKHIPAGYLRASINQRVALLQGLMDTDGSASEGSSLTFTNTNRVLIDQVQELLLSLGVKASIASWTATCKGKDCGPAYGVHFTCNFPAFRLQRKLHRQERTSRITTKRRYVAAVREIESEPTRCITVDSPSHLFLCSRSFIPTHNSETLLVDFSVEVENPNYNAIIFRQSFPELRDLVKKSIRLYKPLGGKFVKGSPMCWTFPSGSTIWLGYMGHDDDVFAHQGVEYSAVGFDEAGHQNEHRIRYMFTRLRSTDPTLKLRMRLTANPGGPGHSFLMKMFLRGRCPHCEPSLAVESGKLYYDAKWPSDGQPVTVTLPGGKVIPKSVAFIRGKLQLGDTDLLGEQYVANLMMQAASTARKLLDGCWKEWEGQFFDCFQETRGVIFNADGSIDVPQPDMRMVAPVQDFDVKYWYPHMVGGDYGFSGSAAAGYLAVRLPADQHFKNGRILVLDEYCEKGVTARDYGTDLVNRWFLEGGAVPERPRAIQMWAVSPDAYRKDGSVNEFDVPFTRLDQMNEALLPYGMAFILANDDRKSGWMKMYQMLRDGELVIGKHCVNTIDMLQSRLRDPKKLDDILKVPGDPLDDLADALRYLIMTWSMQAVQPREERLAAAVRGLDPTNAMMTARKFEIEERRSTQSYSPKAVRGAQRRGW